MAQTKVFRGVARSIVTTADATQYIYHRTAVVTCRADGAIILDSGGWRTATTKLAMNQASAQGRLGFTVYAKRGEWFVSVDTRAESIPFFDGMAVNRQAQSEAA